MKLHQQRHGAVTLLRPEGPLSGAVDVADFARVTRAVTEATLGRFVLDLSVVPFVDSGGLDALLDLTDLLAASGKVLKVCGVNKTVRQVFELTGIDNLFDHFNDMNSAVRSFL